MNRTPAQHVRVLAVSGSTRSVGFALMEGRDTLVAWGNKVVRDGDRNARCLVKIEELIGHYEPVILVLEDAAAVGSRRSKRIQDLFIQVAKASKHRELAVVMFSREAIRQGFFADKPGTRQALAEHLATRFPEQLAHLVPPKRRAWESENHRMPVFDAVALAVLYFQTRKQD